MATKFRMEGLTLTVKDVSKSVDYYCKKLGFLCAWNAAPHFALIRLDGSEGGSIGLLSWQEAKKDGCEKLTKKQARAIHVELSTDDLDKLHTELKAKGVKFHAPPHDEPWERSMTALDPDGYAVEFAQGRRGKNTTKPAKKAVATKKKAPGKKTATTAKTKAKKPTTTARTARKIAR